MLDALKNMGRSTIAVGAIDQNTPNALFVDVRSEDEWNGGHIPWFRHIPLTEIYNHLDEFKQYEKIYFICRSGGRSGMACDILKEAGLTSAVNVLGGMRAWEEAKFPVTR